MRTIHQTNPSQIPLTPDQIANPMLLSPVFDGTSTYFCLKDIKIVRIGFDNIEDSQALNLIEKRKLSLVGAGTLFIASRYGIPSNWVKIVNNKNSRIIFRYTVFVDTRARDGHIMVLALTKEGIKFVGVSRWSTNDLFATMNTRQSAPR